MNNAPPFQQQFNIATAAGQSIIYGFGNIPRTKFSMQVTGNDGTYPANQGPNFLNTGVLAGVPIAPTSWDVWLQGITDLMSGSGSDEGGGTKLLEHVNGTNDNGTVVSVEGPPMDSVQVNWSGVALGTANNILVTITAVE